MQQGNLIEARRAITRALSIRDDQVDILLLDARIKNQMRETRAAYDTYRTILAIDPNNPEALMGTAQLGLATGNISESRDAVERILLLDPAQPDALLIKGVHALNDKNYAEAIAVGDTLQQAQPGDPRGIVLKARGSFLSGKRAEALAMLHDAATQLGNNDMIATALLENARDQSDPAVMLEQLSLLRQARPDSIDLAIDEANVRYKNGDTAIARTIGSEILDQFGDDARSMQRLNDLWLEYDPDPLAPEERAALAQGKLGARLMAARYYLMRGDTAAARSLVGSTDDARAAALAARIDFTAGKPGALAAAEAIARDDKSNCDALATIAEARLRQGDTGAAIVAAQVVAADCLDRNDGTLLLARAYAARKHAPGVERVYREGVAARPLDRQLAAGFAEWLLAQNRPDAAVSAARRLTQFLPAKVSSWRLMAHICERARQPACRNTAQAGEAAARKNFAIDLPPGERTVNPLLGQRWR